MLSESSKEQIYRSVADPAWACAVAAAKGKTRGAPTENVTSIEKLRREYMKGCFEAKCFEEKRVYSVGPDGENPSDIFQVIFIIPPGKKFVEPTSAYESNFAIEEQRVD